MLLIPALTPSPETLASIVTMNKDKPVAAKISLNLLNVQDSGEDFIGLSGTLYQQNLIYSEPRELRRTKESLELSVIFRDRDSFENWFLHSKVREYWGEKFENWLVKTPETLEEMDVIIEADRVENCECNTSDFYILQGRSLQFTDELTCGSCLKQVPYSRIPLDIKIEEWQNYHQRFYLNWLDSGIFEHDAYSELTNYSEGKLNKEGERIRAELSNHFKAPVYLSYFVEEPDSNHPCLICGEKGSDSGLKRPSKICKTCNTIFD